MDNATFCATKCDISCVDGVGLGWMGWGASKGICRTKKLLLPSQKKEENCQSVVCIGFFKDGIHSVSQ